MDSQRTLVLIASNVFVIDLRYKQDTHYRANRRFLDLIAEAGTGFTTVINLNARQLLELWVYFEQKYNVTVLPDTALDGTLPSLRVREIFEWIQKKLSFGDAFLLAAALKQSPTLSRIVTWDKKHFKGKFPGDLFTPAEYPHSR